MKTNTNGAASMTSIKSRDKRDGIILFATLGMLVLLSSLLITAQNKVVNQAVVFQRIFEGQDARNDLQSVLALAAPELMEKISDFESGVIKEFETFVVQNNAIAHLVSLKTIQRRGFFAAMIVSDYFDN